MALNDKVTHGIVKKVTNDATNGSSAVPGQATTTAEPDTTLENVSGLCSQCWNMMAREESRHDLLSDSLASLRSKDEVWESARAGCPICKVVQTKAYRIERASIDPVDCNDFNFVAVTGDGGLDHFRVEANSSTSTPTIITQVDVFTNDESPIANQVRNRPAETISPNDSVMREAIRKYVHHCRLEHSNCDRTTSLPLLPTRVLDIGDCRDPGVGATLPVTLLVTQPNQRAEYTALSYCWGGPQVTILTRASLSCHQKGLDTTQLPQTLLDAIEVTRWLNIRYLWIDALCIIQDEDADKMEEIRQMGEIYKNSTVTIAAARSRAVEVGFLHQQFQPFNTVQGQFRHNGKLEKVLLVPETTPDLGHDPLSLRGWTFQEQMLSPRLLQYGPEAVTWHCASVTAVPIHPRFAIYKYQMPSQYVLKALRAGIITHKRRSPLNQRLHYTDLAIKRLYRQIDPRAPSKKSTWYEMIVNQWPHLVERYCARDLTFANDKLRAIAGIAKEIYNAHPDTYLAGLWKTAIIYHLAWRRDDTQDSAGHVTPPDSCDVPSWSWASMSCPITYKPIRTCDPRYIKTAVQPKSPKSPFGDITGRSLFLSAKIVKLEEDNFFAKYPWKVTFDKPPSDPPTSVPGSPSDVLSSNSQEPGGVWYLLLGVLSTYSSTYSQEPTGLILAKSQGTFARVGLFEGMCHYKSEEKKRMEDFLSKVPRTQVEII